LLVSPRHTRIDSRVEAAKAASVVRKPTRDKDSSMGGASLILPGAPLPALHTPPGAIPLAPSQQRAAGGLRWTPRPGGAMLLSQALGCPTRIPALVPGFIEEK